MFAENRMKTDMKRNLQGTQRMSLDAKYWCAPGTGRLAL